MSSDSEVLGGPSPLPSPIFARCSPLRFTVARQCREYFLQRLERTANMQKRWSVCDVESEGMRDGDEIAKEEDTFEGYPLRKCRSSFDIAMDSLRKEISSLIAQDNDLFRQLLSLHDSIAELRERQRHILDDDYDVEDTDDVHKCRSHSPSLESLSETSPESTLSSRSSLSGHCKPRQYTSKNRRGKNASRPIVFIDKSEMCFRCRKMAPPYRRSTSITNLYYLHEDMESYDSGIHLHHSDSDHEIFV